MKKGFTLSEVLITLGVIGVIAAMTLPVVIKKYQQHVTINRLKKVYAVLNQAFNLSKTYNGDYENWSSIDDIGRIEYVNKYWKPYLKITKMCNNYQECGYSKFASWQNAINTKPNGRGVNEGSFILNDGTFITFHNNTQIIIDLNSQSDPNRYGRDCFAFNLSKKGIEPAGGLYPKSFCNKTRVESDNGEWCSGKIVQDGWKISDDYLW